MIWKYWLGQRGRGLVEGNIVQGSTRLYANDVARFLDVNTGKFNGVAIHPNFHNYLESSSLDKTGSYLSPFVTGIGLYDDEYNLVGMAKLGTPTKILQDYPMNFLVRWDK